MINYQRKAFSMLTALFVIMIMSAIAAMVLSLTSKVIVETTAQYHREQAALLAKSYTEYAIMAVMSNDRNATGSDCIEDIDARIGPDVNNGKGYLVNTRIAYIADSNTRVSTCAATRILDDSGITTTESALNVIIDVYVRYKDPDHPYLSTTPWFTYHKRTLQKI